MTYEGFYKLIPEKGAPQIFYVSDEKKILLVRGNFELREHMKEYGLILDEAGMPCVSKGIKLEKLSDEESKIFRGSN